MKKAIIQNRDIVLFSFQPWDEEIACNFKEIALELARNNRVLYINRAVDRISAITKRKEKKVGARLKSIQKGEGELLEVSPNLWVHNPRAIVESINWLPPGPAYDYLNRVNSRRLAREINKIIGRLGFRNIILINDNDFFRGIHLKELINCSVYIFYVRDFMTYQSWFRKHGQRMEKRMMQQADLVVANSAYLAAYSKKFNSRSYDIGQGCDLQSYQVETAPLPDDMKDIRHPVIGYTGAISGTRLDKNIIEHIAEQLPDCSLVLIGPVTDGFDITSLKRFNNIYFLGRKEPAKIPDYIYHFDICINPQQVNELTIGNYPRKADEYLAMGKPMVATNTEGMQLFANYVFLCRTKEEYVSHIKRILEEPHSQNGLVKKQRQEFALSHTWENSLAKLADVLREFENKKDINAKLEQA